MPACPESPHLSDPAPNIKSTDWGAVSFGTAGAVLLCAQNIIPRHEVMHITTAVTFAFGTHQPHNISRHQWLVCQLSGTDCRTFPCKWHFNVCGSVQHYCQGPHAASYEHLISPLEKTRQLMHVPLPDSVSTLLSNTPSKNDSTKHLLQHVKFHHLQSASLLTMADHAFIWHAIV